MRDELCVEVPAESLNARGSEMVLPRYVNADLKNPNLDSQWEIPADLVPTVSTIFEGIIIGRLSLHYARWQWYRGSSQYSPGPMLEQAYWIGPTPGRWNAGIDTQYDLWQYRDRRERGRADRDTPDIWVIFHLHFDSSRQVSFPHREHTYAAIESITVFHANEAITRDEADWSINWATNGRYPNTARTVIRCSYTPQTEPWNGDHTYWRIMVGHSLDPSDAGWPHVPDMSSGLRLMRI
ncbi:hypothetical protein T440DRAFT_519787 [Plenodomus tracheiphilus IPT5]|uniref:Uncharacterized protein n=1 Tax=Plenodomus tracheiphilus IPT5 TaxID=1408161 RepID=A0A6A7AZA5_9PLEO|nr:hypothetical protein T440DRAFT_519787 [Plenodomus tracheiphilus IPT5]